MHACVFSSFLVCFSLKHNLKGEKSLEKKENMCEEKKISFVIPCYNSENTIRPVVDEIIQVMMEKPECSFEIIMVNDSSTDGVLEILKELAKKNSACKVLDFAINAGQQSALMAGLAYSRGETIVFLDDDFQCPVNELWKLIKPLEEGYDVSYAKYPKKKESLFRTAGSSFNDWMCSLFLDKPKQLQLSNFVAFKRFIAQEMLQYQNPYPYIDGLILRSTRRIVNVEMEERERLSGETNYTIHKLIHLFLNEFTSFSIKPLRIATMTGMLSAVAGIVYMIVIVLMKILRTDIDAGYSSLMAVQLFIGGVIMILLGLCGEYLGRIYISINKSPQYVIRDIYDEETRKEK